MHNAAVVNGDGQILEYGRNVTDFGGSIRIALTVKLESQLAYIKMQENT